MYNDSINNNTSTTIDPFTPDSTTTPVTPSSTAPVKVMTNNFLMLVQEALGLMCDSGNRVQVSDAHEEILCENLERTLNDTGTTQITNYMNTNSKNMDDKTVQTNISLYQTQLSTNTSQADSTTHGMESTLETDNNHLEGFVDMTSCLNTVMGYTANLLH